MIATDSGTTVLSVNSVCGSAARRAALGETHRSTQWPVASRGYWEHHDDETQYAPKQFDAWPTASRPFVAGSTKSELVTKPGPAARAAGSR